MDPLIVSGRIDGRMKQVRIEDGIITDIGDLAQTAFTGATHVQTDGDLLPGYIDVHVHGGGGAEVMDGTEEAFEQMADTHARHGTTGLLLTTVTDSVNQLNRVLSAYEPHRIRTGAEILGFHLEGPFINPEKPGAQPPEHIIPPSVEQFQGWQTLCNGAIRYMTLAPERPGAESLVRFASENGVIVSMGHCNATAEEALAGIDWGARSVTHLFNAMSAAGHREPGLAGTALADNRVVTELIADLVHVHPLMLRTAIRAKGTDRIMLITDAVRVADMPDGEYAFGDQQVFAVDGAVRLADGRLAGSRLTLDQAVRNLISIGALQPSEVAQVTSANQARLLQLPHGKLAVGAPGSFIAVNQKWVVTHTIVKGRLVHRT